MRRLKHLRRFAEDCSGVTAVEYGLLISLVSIACIVAWTQMGDALKAIFQQITSKLG